MPRELLLANGSMLVNFDARYQLRDLYFPHVGEENHTLGGTSRLGFWVDGHFAWLSDWELELRYQDDSLVTQVSAYHRTLQLRVVVNDAVDCESNVLVRRLAVHDQAGRERRVRVFAHFDPYIGESPFANAAYFDGPSGALICYKRDRYFLLASKPAAAEYAVGRKGRSGLDGTWRDAEDGRLSNNPVASGFVDATLMCELVVPALGESVGFVWLAAGRALDEVLALHEATRAAPGVLVERTSRYWRSWLDRTRRDFGDLSPGALDLYRRSLLIVRAHFDANGAVIAASDSGGTAVGEDYYAYVWPRDAALVAEALDMAGHHEAPRRFYVFLRRLLSQASYAPSGCLLHRYTSEGLAAASWHAGVGEGRLRLPIQEDETALVLYGLFRHVQLSGATELARDLYRDFVRQAADFMLIYRDPLTGLPHPSYDLWEEEYGVFLFTCASVVGALEGAAELAERLGDAGPAEAYRSGAAEIRAGVEAHFFDPALDRYVSAVRVDASGAVQRDPVLDSSMAGLFLFGLFPADDPRVVKTMRALEAGLTNPPPVGGVARHGNDYYHHVTGNYADYQGNSWFVSTLWLADWLTAIGDREGARRLIEWCTEHTSPSGVLAEQVHPQTGEALSVSPLTWSHAAFVSSVERYMGACGNTEQVEQAAPWS